MGKIIFIVKFKQIKKLAITNNINFANWEKSFFTGVKSHLQNLQNFLDAKIF